MVTAGALIVSIGEHVQLDSACQYPSLRVGHRRCVAKNLLGIQKPCRSV